MASIISVHEVMVILSESPFYVGLERRERLGLAYRNYISMAKAVLDSKNKQEDKDGKGQN